MQEPDGFSTFVDAHSRSLLRAAWLLTGDWANAEDLVQSALAKAWPRWDRAMSRGTPEAYVRALMTSIYLGWRRRRWTGETPHHEVPERATPDDFGALDDRQSVLDALAVLSPQQRAAIVLRYFADLSEAETAATMRCSTGAVKSHTSRALARLRDVPGLGLILTEGVTP